MGPDPGLGSLGPLCQFFLRAECFGTALKLWIDMQWLINHPVRGPVGRPLVVQHPELHNLQRGIVTNPENGTKMCSISSVESRKSGFKPLVDLWARQKWISIGFTYSNGSWRFCSVGFMVMDRTRPYLLWDANVQYPSRDAYSVAQQTAPLRQAMYRTVRNSLAIPP